MILWAFDACICLETEQQVFRKIKDIQGRLVFGEICVVPECEQPGLGKVHVVLQPYRPEVLRIVVP